MDNLGIWEKISAILEDYCESVNGELDERWRNWKLDLSKLEMYEVITSLLARQVTLVTQLANSPSIWNRHVAPIILRTMVDTHINLAWILKDSLDRSRKFILYGLGQEKLYLEHIKAKSKTGTNDHRIRSIEDWINSQHISVFTEVNLGSWSELSTRDMAEDADCLEIYRMAYQPFSSVAHSMWNHVCKYNLKKCENPLHRYHRVPINPSLPPDIDFFYSAAKYTDITFMLFDRNFNLKLEKPSSFRKFINSMNSLDEYVQKEIEKFKSST